MKNGFFSRFGSRTSPGARSPSGSSGWPPGSCRGPRPLRRPPARSRTSSAELPREDLPRAARKAAISLRVDPEVLEWFKTQGPGYQTRINGVLRAYMDASRQA